MARQPLVQARSPLVTAPSELVVNRGPLVQARAPIGAFLPSDIPGLVRWFDADEPSTLTITSSPDVDAWQDQALSASYAQATAAKKPHTGAVLNSRNGLGFDGVGQTLTNSADTADFVGDKGCHFFVFRGNSFTSNPYLFTGGRNTGNFWSGVQITSAGAVRHSWRAGGAPNLVRATTTISTSTPYIISMASNGTQYRIRINGVAQTLAVDNGFDDGSWFSDVGSLVHSAIGCLKDNNESNFFDGDMFTHLYYDNVNLTTPQTDQVEAYLNDRWAVF